MGQRTKKTCFRSPRLVCPELCRSKTEFNVCLSSQDVVLHCQSWHTDLMCTAWEWKLLWKSFSDFKRTARPACSENIVRRKLNTLTDGIDVPCFFRKKNAHVKGERERESESESKSERDIYLGSTWQEFLPGCQILCANNFSWEGGIAKEAVVCHFNTHTNIAYAVQWVLGHLQCCNGYSTV